jgi:Co/Zn/Cd efflux system component
MITQNIMNTRLHQIRTVALTTHLVMPEGQPSDAFLQEATHGLHHRFQIENVTTMQLVRAQFCQLCENTSAAAIKALHP